MAIFYSFVSLFYCYANAISSPFNKLKLTDKEYDEAYSFFAAGHLYGAPANRDSTFPSSSILAAIDMINSQKPAFFISLGDNYFSSSPLYVSNFIKSFALKLSMPLFTAVGNHDNPSFEENFGSKYFDFTYGSEQFIFLDTELNKGEIKNEQLEYFRKVIKDFCENQQLENLFICTHKPIWSAHHPIYKIVFEHVNNQTDYPNDIHNFKNDIEPLLTDAQLKFNKNIYWISGDIGCSWTLPLFYAKDTKHNITYIATGIGNVLHDAIIKIDINKDGIVKFAPISLTGQKLEPIEYYNIKYWEDFFRKDSIKPTNTQILINKMLKVIRSKYFWMGFLAGLFCLTFLAAFLYFIKKYSLP